MPLLHKEITEKLIIHSSFGSESSAIKLIFLQLWRRCDGERVRETWIAQALSWYLSINKLLIAPNRRSEINRGLHTQLACVLRTELRTRVWLLLNARVVLMQWSLIMRRVPTCRFRKTKASKLRAQLEKSISRRAKWKGKDVEHMAAGDRFWAYFLSPFQQSISELSSYIKTSRSIWRLLLITISQSPVKNALYCKRSRCKRIALHPSAA